MKKISIIAITLFTLQCSACKAQSIQINNQVSLKMPRGSEPLSASRSAMLDTNSVIAKSLNVGRAYVKNEFIIFFNSASEKQLEKNHLEKFALGNKEMVGWAKPKFYESDIKDFPGFRALIICYELPNSSIGQYTISCVNNSNNKILIGTIEYKLGSRDKAKILLDGILETVKFN